MNITKIETNGLGPLNSLSWSPGPCGVLYDDNQQGKTTVIDIVVNTIFKDRMKLFESRYDSYDGCRVQVNIDDASYSFGDGGDTDQLSELLNWDMPELHRFLCIRASDLTLSRPLSSKGPEEIWKALSSVMGGMDQDYIQGIGREIRQKATVTKSLKWSNRKPERLKDRIQQEVVSNLDRAEQAEEHLRELMECRRKRREARDSRDEYREKLSQIEDKFETIERKRVRAELDRADEILGDIRSLNNEIDSRFGDRITESFLEPWEDTNSSLSTVEEKLQQWKEAAETWERIEDLKEQLDELGEDLEGARDEFTQKKEQFLNIRQNEIRPLYREFSKAKASKEKWLPMLEMLTPGLGLSFVLFVGGIGITFLQWIPGLIISSLGLLGMLALGGLLFYKWSLNSTLERCESEANKYAERWPSQATDKPGELLKKLVDVSPEELYPDLSEDIQSLQSNVQTLEGEKSAHLESLETTLKNLGEQKIPNDFEPRESEIEALESKLNSIKDDQEEYRNKTGVPDFEQFQEKLKERAEMENKVQQKMVKLRTILDLEDDENLGIVRSTVERRLEEYSDVTVSDETPEELKERETSLEKQRREAEKILEEAEKTIESLESTERSLSSELSEIGIPFEHPEELFEQVHEWEDELEEAIVDRLAASVSLEVIERMEGDYMGEIRRLLQSDDPDHWSINDLYQSVMGSQYTVDFDVDSLSFKVNDHENTIHETNLSSGARSHLYFSCRMTVLQQLFPDQPGFVILDDPFLHYFPDRKEKIISKLSDMVNDGWQMLLFTVDPTSRDLFKEHLNANVHSVDELEDSTES